MLQIFGKELHKILTYIYKMRKNVLENNKNVLNTFPFSEKNL